MDKIKVVGAEVMFSNGFFIIATISGYNSTIVDVENPTIILEENKTDISLGKSVLDAMKNSRTFYTQEERRKYLDFRKTRVEYDRWVQEMIEKTGSKTKSGLFRRMMNCSVNVRENEIVIVPSHHERSDSWSGKGIKKEDRIHLPLNCSAEELGRAVKLGIQRCT